MVVSPVAAGSCPQYPVHGDAGVPRGVLGANPASFTLEDMPGIDENCAPPTSEELANADTHLSVTRRTVMGVTAGLGGAVALAACGGSSDGAGTSTAPATSPATSSPATAGGTASPGSGGDELAKTADVPVGGGIVLQDQKIVLVQATAGSFTALSATCTHKGCVVSAPKDGKIVCPCHQSEFGLDGSVQRGPATTPLPTVQITTTGDAILRA